jgi:hypothetical protein
MIRFSGLISPNNSLSFGRSRTQVSNRNTLVSPPVIVPKFFTRANSSLSRSGSHAFGQIISNLNQHLERISTEQLNVSDVSGKSTGKIFHQTKKQQGLNRVLAYYKVMQGRQIQSEHSPKSKQLPNYFGLSDRRRQQFLLEQQQDQIHIHPSGFKSQLYTPVLDRVWTDLRNIKRLYSSKKGRNFRENDFYNDNRVKALMSQYPQPIPFAERMRIYRQRIDTYTSAIDGRNVAIADLRAKIQAACWGKTLSPHVESSDHSPPAIVPFYKQVIAEHKASIKPLEQRVHNWQRRIDFLEANETAIRNTDANKLAAVLRQRAESEQPR